MEAQAQITALIEEYASLELLMSNLAREDAIIAKLEAFGLEMRIHGTQLWWQDEAGEWIAQVAPPESVRGQSIRKHTDDIIKRSKGLAQAQS